jgi:hypothetical protein
VQITRQLHRLMRQLKGLGGGADLVKCDLHVVSRSPAVRRRN